MKLGRAASPLCAPPHIATGTKHHEHGYLVQLCDALPAAWICDVYDADRYRMAMGTAMLRSDGQTATCYMANGHLARRANSRT
jgi:hypothetical protein